MKLIQKKIFTSKEFLIENGRLLTFQKGLLKFFEADIPFEDIKVNRIMKTRYVDIFWLGCLLVLSFFFFAILISKLFIPTTVAGWDLVIGLGLAEMIVAFFFLLTWRDEIIIPVNELSISLFQKRPSKREVDQFVNTLKDRIKTYLRNKYMILNSDLEDKARNQQLFWLFENGIISQKEFEENRIQDIP